MTLGLKGLFQAAARHYCGGGLRMEIAPVGVELHGIVIDGGILAHAAAARGYHLLKQRPKLLAAGLRVAGQLAEVDNRALADLAFRIAPVL